jgi:starch-binding outer membrane protein, SusD/RagB family
MTAAHMHSASIAAARCAPDRVRPLFVGRPAALLTAAMIVGSAACADSNVPFYTEPTGVAHTQGGVQNAMTGLFAASRLDVGTYIFWMSQFARDEGNIQFDNPQNIQFGTGLTPIPASDQGVWDNEYRAIGGALAIITAVPSSQPAYTAQQAAAVIGIAQTIEALDFMAIAETRDTLGIPVQLTANGSIGQVYCNKDVWQQIVALLDSANNSLNVAGAIPLPVKLPPGFASVSTAAGPSTTAGSFAAFNRALAGKAGLELAYAIARASGAGPTLTSGGTPNAAALSRADSALTASALYAVPVTVPAAGGFTENAGGVYWDWSAQSGDIVNPINQGIGIWQTLRTFVADVDTVNDARWKAKFGAQTFALQIPGDLTIADTNWIYAYYPATNTPVPIIRNEGMLLYRAQIQLGMGNLAHAIALIDSIHTLAGGYAAPLTIASTYTAVRDSLLKEQRISTVFEGSGDRTISLRMYDLEAVADTTWQALGKVDLHTTVVPIPATEIEGRGGSYTITCP